ncbi:TetR/AcrR family transcriptional regulator [Salinimonas sediminis]|uniref:TetR/AcrR family transcriptional regulator n=1 Tax=Salinimonas sediminis TaxID=2303538 RepID=A0A346NKF0_9ALTE|nr:TetR/AcrR family transcriptional regulator [Salinimonas sediminis]AXR06007.1 TetR/AcrR family transcriptional regulator [Salinimonas sediminis]
MPAGRKRAFDEQAALDAAMNVFWTKGYAGASLAHLTQAMGVNKPSLYSAFGNKEALFIRTTEHYIQQNMQHHLAELEGYNCALGERLRRYMKSIVNMQCEQSSGRGCYLVLCQNEIAGSHIPHEAKALLEDIDAQAYTRLVRLFKEDAHARALGVANRADEHALTLYTVLKGTASMARTGKKAAQLYGVIDTTLSGMGL